MQEMYTVLLGDIISFKNGKKKPSTEGSIPIYGGNGVLGYANQGNYKNSIIVGRVGAYCGSVYYEPQECWISDNAIAAIPKPGTNLHFAFYLLKSLHLNSRHIGTSQPLLTQEILNSIECQIPSLEVQEKVASILASIDSKIETNNKINGNLSEQAFALFDQMLLNHDQDDLCFLCELAEINPKRTIAKNEIAKCIDMAKLSTTGAFPDGWEDKPYTGGMKFINGDTLLARITPCLENGKTAYIDFLEDGETAFGSTEYVVLAAKGMTPPEMLYCLARNPKFVDYAVKNMNGSSGRQRVSGETIGQYLMPNLSEEELLVFGENVRPLFLTMRNNSLENIRLVSMRDSLIPRLMSGELDVSELSL